MKTIVVNMFAGPGAGKTTCAWQIASELKKRGYVTEYVPEYAKELVWDKNFDLLDGTLEHQKQLLEEQSHRLDRLVGQVDFIVTDSPVLLNAIYYTGSPEEKKGYTDEVYKRFASYNNFSVFIQRGKSFEQAGRIHDLEQSLKIDQQIEEMFELLYAYGNAHGQLKVPMHFLMDEFANITLPKDFDKRLATFRKYLISASIILQDQSQLKAIYEKQWQSVINNCDSLLYLGGNESGTHEYLSKLLGKQTIRTNTFGQSKGRNGSFSKNEQQLGRELMTPDEIRQMDNDYSILLIRGEPPLYDRKYDLNHHPNIKYTTFENGKPYRHDELTHIGSMIELVPGLTKEEVKKIPALPPIKVTWVGDDETPYYQQ